MELTVPLKTAETGLGTLQTSINHTDDLKTFLRDSFLLFDELKHCCALSPTTLVSDTQIQILCFIDLHFNLRASGWMLILNFFQRFKLALILNAQIIPSRGPQYVSREPCWSSLIRAPPPPPPPSPSLPAAGCTGAHCCTALLSGFTPLYFANDTVALSTFGERERKRTARADINNTSTHAGSELLQTHGVSCTGTKLEQDGKRNKGRLCFFVLKKKAALDAGSARNSITTGKHCSTKQRHRKSETN